MADRYDRSRLILWRAELDSLALGVRDLQNDISERLRPNVTTERRNLEEAKKTPHRWQDANGNHFQGIDPRLVGRREECLRKAEAALADAEAGLSHLQQRADNLRRLVNSADSFLRENHP